jgi:peptidoglycan L-alanyl-D-glutamate endopeptidase CwlK
MDSKSLDKLKECHPDLQTLIRRVDEVYPVQVICGFRSNEDQQKAFDEGKSKAPPGKSKHNQKPSLAVDVVPDPDRNHKTISWTDLTQYEIMCFAIEQIAEDLNIKIRLGRDFSIVDWPHVELK